MNPIVSAYPTPDYTKLRLEAAVAAHFEALRADELFRPGMRVVLKPNLLMGRRPEDATTTHPALLAAVIGRLRRLGVDDIVIADSPGGPYTAAYLKGVYRTTGMEGMAAEEGVHLNLETGYREVEHGEGLCRRFNVIDPVAGADAVINLPKLKTHGMMLLSMGVKNMFGCVPGLQKPELHFRFKEKARFGQMLVELCQTVKPCITIVDAVMAMEGNGPSGGLLRELGMTFAARDVYALDRKLCDFVGVDPREVDTVRYCIEQGLCPQDAAAIHWAGDSPAPISDFLLPESRSVDFSQYAPGPLKKPVGALLDRFFTPRPVIRRRECIGCGKCAESCAPGAATVVEGKARIRYAKCIGCYCCHEMCPVRAIGIRRSPLGRGTGR